MCVRGRSTKGGDKDVPSVWKKPTQWVLVPFIAACDTEGAGLGDKMMSLTLELGLGLVRYLRGGGSWDAWLLVSVDRFGLKTETSGSLAT